MAQAEPERLPSAAPGPLPAAVEAHPEAIHALCREYGAVHLELFGSALTPGFDPETSDIDLLVESRKTTTMVCGWAATSS